MSQKYWSAPWLLLLALVAVGAGVGLVLPALGKGGETTAAVQVAGGNDGALRRPAVLHSVAELRTLAPGAAGDVLVQGYYRPGDGGEGTFWWDGQSLAADNGGTVIAAAGHAGSGRWLRIYSGPVYPEWFGAKKDGSDDSAAIRAALNVSGELGLRGGTYTISGLAIAKSNFSITGAGINKTIIDCRGVRSGDALQIGYDRDGGSKYVSIRDLTITDSRESSPCDSLLSIVGGTDGHRPSQTSAFIELSRVLIAQYNNRNGTAALARNLSHLTLNQFNTAYRLGCKYALVLENQGDVNTGVTSIENCYLQARKTALCIRQSSNLLDTFTVKNTFLANFSNPDAAEVVRLEGVISALVFEGNHLEGRSDNEDCVVYATGKLCASTFRANHFSCGTNVKRARHCFRFSGAAVSACSFTDNEVLRAKNAAEQGDCFYFENGCQLNPGEPVLIARVWRNSTSAELVTVEKGGNEKGIWNALVLADKGAGRAPR